MIVGIDDTDSRSGMCTTYLCTVLVDELKSYGEVSTPVLVRLNPCIPFKTRGNGAVAFEILINEGLEREVKEIVKARVTELSELRAEGTNPGVVFIDDNASKTSTEKLKRFYETAVREVLAIEDAYAIISELQLDYFGLKNKRGLIGALAAASFLLLHAKKSYDYTYELIVYRRKERWGTLRFIEDASVWAADEATYPLVWDTVDVANKKLVLVPHSPCPVLFGIRGDSVDAIYKAYGLIQAEPEERKMLFITNQGTDCHLKNTEKLWDYHSYILDGVVASNPRTIEGGHVLFSLSVQGGNESVDCIAYEPTKGFRAIVRELRIGDEVTVYGSLKEGTLNLEKIELRKLNLEVERTPRCNTCGRNMKSAGRSQGYRCKRCGTFSAVKDKVIVERAIETGLYEVPPVARRHISKPLVRMRRGDKIIHPSR
ncbi:tRNA(Ile2) 2-agmatinylcytidine synthetase [ANME-1 cluster archaeon AG-394-G21]|nr:tRNA(Ile2) 2-agmatinylcytidine synthetase [ANME-1 cluster archaeon AG-394-G21]